MANELKVGSSNYLSGTVSRADAGSVTFSSATAFIFLASDTTETALTNSSITLNTSATPAFHGTFPPTVTMTAGLSYKIRTTITLSDGSKGIRDLEVVASAG